MSMGNDVTDLRVCSHWAAPTFLCAWLYQCWAQAACRNHCTWLLRPLDSQRGPPSAVCTQFSIMWRAARGWSWGTMWPASLTTTSVRGPWCLT